MARVGVHVAFSIVDTALGAKLSFLTTEMRVPLVLRHAVHYCHLFAIFTLVSLVINGGVVICSPAYSQSVDLAPARVTDTRPGAGLSAWPCAFSRRAGPL